MPSLALSHDTETVANPLDLVEQVVSANEWEFDRRSDSDMAAEAFSSMRTPAIAAAKARAGEAAGIGAGLAHQIHGALGFTYEHSLHFLTKRLQAWRGEYGGEAEWNAWLGHHLATAGADQLWAELTAI